MWGSCPSGYALTHPLSLQPSIYVLTYTVSLFTVMAHHYLTLRAGELRIAKN